MSRRLLAAVGVAVGIGLPTAIVGAWAAHTASARALALWGLPASAVAAAASALTVIVLQAKERRAIETRMRLLEASAAALFSAIPDGLAVVRGDELVAVNARFCELLGYPSDALVGTTGLFPHIAPEHRHELDDWLAALHDDGYAEGTLVVRNAAGGRVAVEAAGRAIDESDGLGPGHVVTVRDVSARRRHGARLAELATRDPQTRLLNQRGSQERLAEEVRRASLTAQSLSVALLAVGAEALGEDVFVNAAKAIKEQIRVGEHLARTREHEIAWILTSTDAEGARTAVARLRADVARSAPNDARGIVLTAGICDLEAAEDVGSLYALAGRALAQAVRTQTGTTECYAPLAASVLSRRAHSSGD
jgi:PAS domain S-box-containing protein